MLHFRFPFRHSIKGIILLIVIYILWSVVNSINSEINYRQFRIIPEGKCVDLIEDAYRTIKKTLPIPNPNLVKPGDHLKVFDSEIFNAHTWLERPVSLNLTLKEQLMNLLESFLEMLKQHNISFVMSQGMLLGSYFFHDLVPWDDDLDIFIDLKDISKLRQLFMEDDFKKYYGVHSFNEQDNLNMYSKENLKLNISADNAHICGKKESQSKTCYQTGKIYRLDSQKAGSREWNYPFVDFIFFINNGTHVINYELPEQADEIVVKKEDYYPFVKRPFNRFWIPAPSNSRKFLQKRYRYFKCIQGPWDHVNERYNYIHKWFARKAPCKMLKDCYPYVKRRRLFNHTGNMIHGQLIEYLMYKDVKLQSVLLEGRYDGAHVLTL